MKLTPEEFRAASAYEMQMQTAIRSDYLRNVGRSGLAILVPIYERVAGRKERVDSNCAACILGFLKRLGAIYFADKAEREQQEAAEPTPEAEATPAPAAPRRRRTKTEAEE